MLKCRMNRGVTGLRPPPGGAHADTIVTSCQGKSHLGHSAKEKVGSVHPNGKALNQ